METRDPFSGPPWRPIPFFLGCRRGRVEGDEAEMEEFRGPQLGEVPSHRFPQRLLNLLMGGKRLGRLVKGVERDVGDLL